MRNKIKGIIVKNKDVVILTSLCVLLCLPILINMNEYVVADDIAFHAERIKTAFLGWSDGQILPHVNYEAIEGFGYAYNLFYGPLITYIAAAVFALVPFWPIVYNLMLCLIIFLATFLMRNFVLKVTSSRRWACLTSISYILSSYYFSRFYLANSVGELAAFCFVPVLFLGLWQLVDGSKYAFINISIGCVLIILSHNLSVILVAIPAIIFLILNGRNVVKKNNLRRIIRQCILSLLIIFIATAFFVLPLFELKAQNIYAIFNQDYVELADHMSGDDLNYSAVTVIDMVSPNLDNCYIGCLSLLYIFLYPVVVRKDKKTCPRVKKLTNQFYIISIVLVVFSTGIINWQYMPFFLRRIQFPWRFLGPFSFFAAFMDGYILFTLSRNWKILVFVRFFPVILLRTALSIVLRTQFEADYIFAGLGSSAEYLPYSMIDDGQTDFRNKSSNRFWTDADMNVYRILSNRGSNIRNLDSGEEITNFMKEGTKINFEYSGSSCWLEMPLTYYPGYQAKAGDSNLEATNSEGGLVKIHIPYEFDGRIEIHYGLSFWSKIGMLISYIGSVVIFLISYRYFRCCQVKRAKEIFVLCIIDYYKK